MILSVCFGASLTLFSDLAFRMYPSLVPQTVMFWGIFGAFVITTPFFIHTKKQREKVQVCLYSDWKILIFVSVITSFAAFLWWIVLSQSSSGIVSLLGKTDVIFALLFGRFFLGEVITKRDIYFIIILMIGVLLISHLKGEITFSLASLMLVNRFLYMLQSFIVKKHLPNIDGYTFGYVRMGIMSLAVGVGLLFWGGITTLPAEVLGIVILGTSLGMFSRMLYFEAHKYLPMSKLNLFALSKPILVLLAAFILWGDPLSLQKIFGGGLILFGLWGINTTRKKDA